MRDGKLNRWAPEGPNKRNEAVRRPHRKIGAFPIYRQEIASPNVGRVAEVIRKNPGISERNLKRLALLELNVPSPELHNVLRHAKLLVKMSKRFEPPQKL